MMLFLPREHGAWGALLIPFLTTAAIARRADAPVVLCLAAAFLFYLARHPLELLLAPQAQRFYRGGGRRAEGNGTGEAGPVEKGLASRTLIGWFALYATLGTLAGLPLLLIFERQALLVLAVIAAVFFILRVILLRRRAERSLLGEWLVVPGLTLTAPAAWVAATGTLDRTALLLWLLHTLFFSSGIFYVKFRIRALQRKAPFESLWQRLAFAGDLITYHLLMLVFAAAVVHIGRSANLLIAPRGPVHWAGWIALLPFLPVSLRALARVVWLGRRFEIKRVGWTEVAHALVFAALLVLTFGLRS